MEGIALNFQHRRFVICFYTLFLILSITINICMFETKADDSILCPLQYENLECYSDKQGRIVTLQRGNGQTIIGSSKADAPIMCDGEYDFSKKCENSIYLFKSHIDKLEDESWTSVDVTVYSITKHEICCKNTFDVSVSDPKKCVVLKGGNVCVVSSKFRKNMFVCKCSPQGKVKIHRFGSDVESISTNPDGTVLYAKLADENKVVAYGHTSFKEMDVIDTEDDIEPYFLHENVFVDADGGTYIKNVDAFVPFVKLGIFNNCICFEDPYLIYASASDKINFVNVTLKEEYASMKVYGEVVHLAACKGRNKDTLLIYVVKRDDKLFYNKMKVDDAISRISLAVSEGDKDLSMNSPGKIDEEQIHKSEKETKEQESQCTDSDTHDESYQHVDKFLVNEDNVEESMNLVTDDEVIRSLKQMQSEIDQLGVQRNLSEFVKKQEEVQVLDDDVSQENYAKANPLDGLQMKDRKALEVIQTQVKHKDIQKKLNEVAQKAVDDLGLNDGQMTPEETSADDINPVDVEYVETKSESEIDKITEEKVKTSIEGVRTQVKHKDIQKKLNEVARKAVDDLGLNDGQMTSEKISADDKRWIPLKVKQGLFDSTKNDRHKDKKTREALHREIKHICAVPDEVTLSQQVDSTVLVDKNALTVPKMHSKKYIRLHKSKQNEAESVGYKIAQRSSLKKSEIVNRNGSILQGPKRKRTKLVNRKDDISLPVSMISDGEFLQETASISQQIDLSKGVSKFKQSSLSKGRRRKIVSGNSVLSKKEVSKSKQNSLQKSKLRKFISERSVVAKDLFPKLDVQESAKTTLNKEISISLDKKRICLKDVREYIYRSKVYKLNLKKNFIYGVDIDTSFSQFKKNIDLDDNVNVIFKKKGKPMTNGRIGTNTVVEFNTEDMGVITLTAVVPGDLTGSGKTNQTSLKTVCRHIFKDKMLEGAYFEAGDINGDGVVDTLDLLLLSKMIEERS